MSQYELIREDEGDLAVQPTAWSRAAPTVVEAEAFFVRSKTCLVACEGIPTKALEAGVLADMVKVCEWASNMRTRAPDATVINGMACSVMVKLDPEPEKVANDG